AVPGSTDRAATLPILRDGISRVQLFWFLHCTGCIAFGIAMFAWGLDFLTPREALLNKGLLVVTGFIVTLFLRALYRAVRARSLHPLVTALVVFIISFASATVWRETQQWLFVAIYQLQAAEKISLRLFTIPLGTLMYDGFVLLAWSLLYFGINDW